MTMSMKEDKFFGKKKSQHSTTHTVSMRHQIREVQKRTKISHMQECHTLGEDCVLFLEQLLKWLKVPGLAARYFQVGQEVTLVHGM